MKTILMVGWVVHSVWFKLSTTYYMCKIMKTTLNLVHSFSLVLAVSVRFISITTICV